MNYFRGSELQNYFTKVLEDNLKAIAKPQYVDHIPKAVKGEVGQIMSSKDERGAMEAVCDLLELNHILDRPVEALSGGELQRFAIGILCVQKADVYMFDEPSSYLDVSQRLNAAKQIRSMLDDNANSYVVVIEHDLAVLDYLSDFICALYGVPGAYGVVTMPFGVREGINMFLSGYNPTENMRFRDFALSFNVADQGDGEHVKSQGHQFMYPEMSKTMGKYTLHVDAGGFSDSEIIVLLGQNGCGKTTLIRLMAGLLKPDGETEVPQLNVSYKPQKIQAKFEGTVRQLLHKKIREMYIHPQFVSDVMKPMMIDPIFDQVVTYLSGGELQRVALTLALGTPADLYLIDEPSAYLDSEQRLVAAKVIKRFVLHAKKTAFIVEHDFIMATYLADRVIVYDGKPGVECWARPPQSLLTGMNKFLAQLEITFRYVLVHAHLFFRTHSIVV